MRAVIFATPQPLERCRVIPHAHPVTVEPAPYNHVPARSPMLDVIYILIGAVFLGGCGLYAIACEHL